MWDLNDITAPEPEAVLAEREIVEAIVANETRVLDNPEQPVRFKRLRNGTWGISGPAALLVDGAIVVVSRRDGSTTTVVVGRMLWSGDGKAICTRRA